MGSRQPDERLLVAAAGGDEQCPVARDLGVHEAVGGAAPSSLQALASNEPGTSPSARKRIPSGPGTMRRSWPGPTRTIIPGRKSNAWSSASSTADPASGT